MSTRKPENEEWSDVKAKKYLDSQYLNEKVRWVIILDEGLYGFIASDGVKFASADNNKIWNMGIIEFLKRNGGEYVSN